MGALQLESLGPAALGARSIFRWRRLARQRPRITAELRVERISATEVEVSTAAGARLRLNETAREILELCDGERSVRALGASLAGRYEVSLARLRPQVADTLVLLRRAGVVAW
ncbi:MAG: PqqD family protein [Deltaproteobacteria bacterium]|nr:PqqD family protein [Deltaproteobacteria bacterium]